MSDPFLPATWETYARALGVELRRCRLESGLAQDEVAHAAGIARTYYQQLEHGALARGKTANPSLRVLTSVGLALDVAPSRLLPSIQGLTLPLV